MNLHSGKSILAIKRCPWSRKQTVELCRMAANLMTDFPGNAESSGCRICLDANAAWHLHLCLKNPCYPEWATATEHWRQLLIQIFIWTLLLYFFSTLRCQSSLVWSWKYCVCSCEVTTLFITQNTRLVLNNLLLQCAFWGVKVVTAEILTSQIHSVWCFMLNISSYILHALNHLLHWAQWHKLGGNNRILVNKWQVSVQRTIQRNVGRVSVSLWKSVITLTTCFVCVISFHDI